MSTNETAGLVRQAATELAAYAARYGLTLTGSLSASPTGVAGTIAPASALADVAAILAKLGGGLTVTTTEDGIMVADPNGGRSIDTVHVAVVPLGDADTPGGIAVWENTTGVDVIVRDLLIYLTAGGGDTVDFNDGASAGVAANGTTLSDSFNSSGLGGGIGLDPDVVPKFIRVSSFVPNLVPAGHCVTVSTVSGSAEGIRGFLYLDWHRAA